MIHDLLAAHVVCELVLADGIHILSVHMDKIKLVVMQNRAWAKTCH